MKKRLTLILGLVLLCIVGTQAQTDYWLFHTTADNSNGNGGDKAVVGADLYKSDEGKNWIDADPNNGETYNMTSFTYFEKSQHENGVDKGRHYKVPEAFTYYLVNLQWKSVDYSETVNCNFLDTSNWTEATTWDEATINQHHASHGEANNCVKFAVEGEYEYYWVHVENNNPQAAQLVNASDLTPEQIDGATAMDLVPGTNSNYGGVNVWGSSSGDYYFKIPKYNYFKKKKSWSDAISINDIPGDASIQYVDWTDNKDNHLGEVNAGTYYAIGSDFHYYYIGQETVFVWQLQEYADGDHHPLIALYKDATEMVDPTSKDKYCTVGGSTYTRDESSWNEDVPATVATSWNNGTLTVGTNETRSISELLTAYNISSSDVTKVVFADGSTWENGVLTTKTTEYEANKQNLADAGFSVGTVKAGNYVTIVGGVTTITIPEGDSGVIGNLKTYTSGSGKLSKLEKQLICKATDMKIVGALSNAEWGNLADDAGSTSTPTSYVTGYEDKPKQATDDEGNPMFDENNNPVYIPVYEQATDNEGNLLFDEDGNPIIVLKKDDQGNQVYVTEKVATMSEPASFVHNLDLTDAKISDGSAGSATGCTLRNGFAHVESVLLPTDSNYKVIPENFATSTQLQSITIPANVESVGKSAFAGCSRLTTVNFDANGNLKIIGESSFENCNITGDLVIPASVQIIDKKAFKNSYHISSLTIPAGSHLSTYYGANNGIKEEAFWMDGEHNDLDNVYILEDQHLIACDVKAFDYDNTDGQTRMSTVKTRLHYPASLYYYYVGEWKSRVNGGVVAGHDDLLALRNLIENENHTVTLSPYSAINPETGQQYTVTPDPVSLTDEEIQWVNGFQKFVSSGIPVTFDTEWRTYCDVVNLRVPAAANKVADVYIVCGYEASEVVNEGMVVLKKMEEGDIIPAHTGIIIKHYVTDTQNGGVLSFPHVTETLTEEQAKPYRFVRDDDSRMDYHPEAPEFTTGISTRLYVPSEGTLTGDYANGYPNYLEFIDCKGRQRVVYNAENGNIIDWTTLEMGKKAGQTVTYRNFLFGNGKQIQYAKEQAEAGNVYNKETNPNGYRDYTASGWDPNVHGKMGWGFFRCKSAYYKVNSKAFLHYPAEVFANRNGGAATATINGAVIAGAKPLNLFIYDTEEKVATFIDAPSAPVEIVADDAFYTLEGVKVIAPTKAGIYIHNGKKIVLK